MKYNLLLILVFFIFGCSKEEKNYFPLEKIKTWNYSIEIEPEVEEKILYKTTSQSLGEKKVNHNNETFTVYPLLKENGTVLYYQNSNDGVYRNGIQFSKDSDIDFKMNERMVLPKPIKLGKKWDVESKTYLILKRYPYYDYRATTNFKLIYEVISMSETIQTPVGKFKNCLKIKGIGKTSFIGDSEIGSIGIDVLSEEWYAENVGLIKKVRTEKTDTDLFGTTRMTQLLNNFSKR